MKAPRWARRSDDEIVKFLVRNGVRVTRASYIGLNWWGEYDPKELLPPELESELPVELQLEKFEEC